MKLEIEEVYAEYDDDFTGDCYQVTLRVGDKVVLQGDTYHNKIDHQIEGFVEALKFLAIDHTIETTRRVSNDGDGF